MNSGLRALPVMCAKLCVQPHVCRKSLVQCVTGIGPVYTFPSPSLPPTPAATSFCLCASLLSLSCPRELIPLPVPSPAFLREGIFRARLGGTGTFVNSVGSELDPSTPASLGRHLELGALLRGKKKAYSLA